MVYLSIYPETFDPAILKSVHDKLMKQNPMKTMIQRTLVITTMFVAKGCAVQSNLLS